MYDLLLKNAETYGPGYLGKVDIGIVDGKIAFIGSCTNEARKTIDCSKQIVLPGAIETHAHMLLPFGGTKTLSDFYEGSKFGAFGGVTTLIDFADQERGGSAMEAFEARMLLASESAIDYSLHCTLTDITNDTLKDIPRLIGRGVTSFKFYTAYSESGLYLAPEEMSRAFEAVADNGALATVHCEDENQILAATEKLVSEGKTEVAYFSQSRPDSSEEVAIENVIDLAEKTGVKLLIRHVSSAAGVKLIEAAQKRGLTVIGETCPHYLTLTRDVYLDDKGPLFICNPPIRGQVDSEALWLALEDDVKFIIGTDDCCFNIAQKTVSDKFNEIPGGMPGIETRVPILLSLGVKYRNISLQRMAHILSTDVAKLYGIYPQKGTVEVGTDADLMIVEESDPYELSISQLHGKSDYTPFEGMQLTYRVAKTISNGKLIVDDGEFLGKRSEGRYLKRQLPVGIEEL